MKKIRLFTALSAVLLLGGLASCEPRTDSETSKTPVDSTNYDDVKMTIGVPVEHNEFYDEVITSFKKENPQYANVSFEKVNFGEGDAFSSVSKDVQAAPDVYSFASDQLFNLINAGALAQIGGSYKTAVESENLEGMVNGAKKDNDLYAFPISADNGYFLYYNTDVVKNYSETTTFADVLAACDAANKKFVVPMGDAWYGYGMFAGFGAKYNVTYENGKETKITANYNEAPGLNAANFMIDIANTAGFQYADGGASGDKSVVLNDYIQQNVNNIGAVIVGTWKYTEITQAWGEDKTACTYLPLMKEGDSTTRMRSFIGGKMLGVNKTKPQKNQKVSLDFAKYASSEAIQLKRFEKLSVGPSNIKASENETVAANKSLVGLAEQVKKAGDVQINVPGSFWEAVQGFGASVGFKKEVTKDNVQEKLDKLQENITTITTGK